MRQQYHVFATMVAMLDLFRFGAEFIPLSGDVIVRQVFPFVVASAVVVFAPQFACAQLPANTPVINANTVDTFGGYNDAGDSVVKVPASGVGLPFSQALRITRKAAGPFIYSAAVIWQSIADVRKDDLIVATFYARNLTPGGKPLKVDVSFQLNDTPFTQALAAGAPVNTTSWQKYAIPFRMQEDFLKGKTSLQIRYGALAQAFEVGGIALVNYGKVGDPIPAALANSFAYYYPDRGNPSAAWRVKALANIEATRKGDMTVRVVRANGAPVSGVSVAINQYRSEFVWGSAAEARTLVCDVKAAPDTAKSCGPVAAADIPKYRSALAQNFEGSSFFNNLKWPDWEDDRQNPLDALDWMKRNGLKTWRGHNLIWPGFEPFFLLPADVRPLTPPATIKQRIDAHFAEELGTLRGRINEWDVVNEAYDKHDIQGLIAAPGVTAEAGVLDSSEIVSWFKNARKGDPKAVLFLNEFNIFDNFDARHEQYDLALVKYIQARGGPVDGVGFQGHFAQNGPVFSEMDKAVADFDPLVKSFAVTEFDFLTVDPKMQADLTSDFMTYVFGSPKFTGFQMWGFWDGDQQQGNEPLFTKDWQLKPSGKVWQELTRRTWRTNANAVTDPTGSAKLRAFYGLYRIIVPGNGKTCTTYRFFSTRRTTLTVPPCQ
jgi:GH35 family endo-1,4-beta-xylanase